MDLQEAPSVEEKPLLKTRFLARLKAVQALYQIDLVGTKIEDFLKDDDVWWWSKDDDESYSETSSVDSVFFRDIVQGVVREQKALDVLIGGRLMQGWSLPRIDSTLRAILRSGAYELGERMDVPARVVVDEYVKIAHTFLAVEEASVANAILDAIARSRRAEEFTG